VEVSAESGGITTTGRVSPSKTLQNTLILRKVEMSEIFSERI
jgi:hypothetical protein